MQRPPFIDIIIPAYNEAQSIGQVIADIPAELVRNIIVCNNNSTDQTAAVAHASGAMIADAPQKGYGSACLAGMALIQSQFGDAPPDIVVFMDADYSDFPQEMQFLIDLIEMGNDLVIGSRVRGNAAPGSLTIPQKFGNWLATNLIHRIYGFRFTDLGPVRAIRWESLLKLDMKDPNYGWTVEMQVKALKHKLHCAEVAVSYRKRIGKSKVSGTIKGSVLAGYKILWTIFRSI
jgi:glycosyltransferase involved in cell wall biosynthesis